MSETDGASPAPAAPSTTITVRDRMRTAGISDDRIALHLANGWIQVDGRVVASLDEPAPPPARIDIVPS